MATEHGLISIVTPSFNQGAYIRATIESVKAQDYDQVEHIVIDGGSTDDTLAVLAEYPHLTVVSEPDNGHADAINKGFRMSKGNILGFLNSDDTLAPGALNAVARAISPKDGVHVVLGKCRFIDAGGEPTGIQHPSYFTSHRRLLEIWAGHGIPQPSVFWSRDVWERCGPMDENLNLPWIDYDFFCRVSRLYPFRVIDQQISCYRLHLDSQTVGSSEAQRLEECIQISRRHWGPLLAPKHLYLALSLARFRFDRIGKARRLLAKCHALLTQGRWLRAGLKGSLACLLAPVVCLHCLVYPVINRQAINWIRKFILWNAHRQRSAAASVYEDHTKVWEDGWVGPRLETRKRADDAVLGVLIRGIADTDCLCEPLDLDVRINAGAAHHRRVSANGPFEVLVRCDMPMPAEETRVDVQTKQWFVMDDVLHNGDMRPLAWKLESIDLITDASLLPQ